MILDDLDDYPYFTDYLKISKVRRIGDFRSKTGYVQAAIAFTLDGEYGALAGWIREDLYPFLKAGSKNFLIDKEEGEIWFSEVSE